MPPSARDVAVEVLERAYRDGAFAAAALDTALERRAGLDARDRALATELVYGVLRTRAALEARLARYVPRALPDDSRTLLPLLVGAYQLAFLDRVPAHAAVDAAVRQVRFARGPKVAGFANALLRKLSADPGSNDRDLAIVESAPAWLLAALEASVGQAEARALLGANDPATPRTSVRARPSGELPGWLAAAEPGRASPVALLVPRSGDLRRRPGYAEGAFVIQEEGAQVVGLALGARAGERVLDACAGRGQKTVLLRDRVGDASELFAADLYPEKLAAIVAECARLGIAPPETRAVDWTLGAGGVPDGFDRVLVDAPCTGTGTLRHRPEIALRLEPAAPARLGALASAILRRAAGRARAGGRVVFSVCSVLREECEDVVESVADVLEPAPFDAEEVAPLHAPGATSFRVLPLAHGTDGFFVASFVRRAIAP